MRFVGRSGQFGWSSESGEVLRQCLRDRLAGAFFYEQPLASRVDFQEHLFTIRGQPHIDRAVNQAK
jgi:hypothetical protein